MAEHMSPQERKKLERIVRELESALEAVREILGSVDAPDDRDAASPFDAAAELMRLRTTSRAEVEARLSELRQQDLGALFVQAGGPGADRKKPKVWLVEQVLWRLFDFARGHEAIRGRSEI